MKTTAVSFFLAAVFVGFATDVSARCSIGQESWVTAIDQLKVDARWNQSEKTSAIYHAPAGYVIVESKVHEHSNHWGSVSVSVIAGKSKFATSSDFEDAHNYALDIYGKYAGTDSKKEIDGKLRQATNSKSRYSRQFSSTNNAVYAEVGAHGSGNFFDQQGGWIVISVSAKLVCVGDPDPKQLARDIVAASNLPVPASIKNIKITNGCDERISFALRYRDIFGKWNDAYWYSLDPAESKSFKSKGKEVATTEGGFYFYGKSNSHKWEGKNENDQSISINNETYNLRKIGNTQTTINCKRT